MNFGEAFADELQKKATLLETGAKGVGFLAKGIERLLQGFQVGRKIPQGFYVRGTTPGQKIGLVAGVGVRRLVDMIKASMGRT